MENKRDRRAHMKAQHNFPAQPQRRLLVITNAVAPKKFLRPAKKRKEARRQPEENVADSGLRANVQDVLYAELWTHKDSTHTYTFTFSLSHTHSLTHTHTHTHSHTHS